MDFLGLFQSSCFQQLRAGPGACQIAEETTGYSHLPHYLFRCKSRTKQAAGWQPPGAAFYSKRRISTGSNDEAARAGTIVAAVEIPIAISVIQIPSSTLG